MKLSFLSPERSYSNSPSRTEVSAQEGPWLSLQRWCQVLAGVLRGQLWYPSPGHIMSLTCPWGPAGTTEGQGTGAEGCAFVVLAGPLLQLHTAMILKGLNSAETLPKYELVLLADFF